jgi:hypothetical protein
MRCCAGLVTLLAASGCKLYFGDHDRAATTVDATPDAAEPTTPKRVFITSTTYTAELGGLAGADAKCGERAAAAGVAGTYKAWLSSDDVTAASRLTHSSAAYQLVDGTPIAASWDDVISGLLLHPIDLYETGATDMRGASCFSDSASAPVWTATAIDGGHTWNPYGANFTCTNWTMADGGYGALGSSCWSDQGWTDVDLAEACVIQAALYCFEQ